jgi:hypothetical protein
MQHSIPIKRRRSASEIRKLVDRFRASGLSRADFVRHEEICLSTLHRYLQSQSAAHAGLRHSAPPSFLEVESGEPPAVSSAQRGMYRLSFNSGLALEIPPGFSRDEVTVLLAVISKARR